MRGISRANDVHKTVMKIEGVKNAGKACSIKYYAVCNHGAIRNQAIPIRSYLNKIIMYIHSFTDPDEFLIMHCSCNLALRVLNQFRSIPSLHPACCRQPFRMEPEFFVYGMKCNAFHGSWTST